MRPPPPQAKSAPPPQGPASAAPADRRQSGRSSGVEHNLAKVGVEGSNPFARSSFPRNVEGQPLLRRGVEARLNAFNRINDSRDHRAFKDVANPVRRVIGEPKGMDQAYAEMTLRLATPPYMLLQIAPPMGLEWRRQSQWGARVNETGRAGRRGRADYRRGRCDSGASGGDALIFLAPVHLHHSSESWNLRRLLPLARLATARDSSLRWNDGGGGRAGA